MNRAPDGTALAAAVEEEIPIHTLEYEPPPPPPVPAPVETAAPPPGLSRGRFPAAAAPAPEVTEHPEYRLPATDLLNEIPGRSSYDSIELKEIATRIKAKFEEFNVHGNVVQINPGPVVTTFEFKPEAGIKYSRITTLSEDLCLGLQAESILIERIPGKPTVGIEVPNSRRELISLRQILESEEFGDSNSRLDHLPGQGHQWTHQGCGARIHAAPADRRIDGRGKERDAQFHDHVDPVQGDTG